MRRFSLKARRNSLRRRPGPAAGPQSSYGVCSLREEMLPASRRQRRASGPFHPCEGLRAVAPPLWPLAPRGAGIEDEDEDDGERKVKRDCSPEVTDRHQVRAGRAVLNRLLGGMRFARRRRGKGATLHTSFDVWLEVRLHGRHGASDPS